MNENEPIKQTNKKLTVCPCSVVFSIIGHSVDKVAQVEVVIAEHGEAVVGAGVDGFPRRATPQ